MVDTNALKPEILLAVQEGTKAAMKQVAKTAGDLRDASEPDQVLKNVVIDLQLELDEVKIGHDTDKAPTVSIPLLASLALFIRRSGFQRDNAMELIREAMTEALTLDKKAEKALLAETGVAECVKTLKDEVIDRLPRTRVKKSVRVKGATLTVKSAGLGEDN